NLRLIRVGETKAFQSIDGRYLAFQTFQTPPVRTRLLLQLDDTVITPLPGTVVVTPTFSARPSPTPQPVIVSTPAPSGLGSTNNDSFWYDWIRPLIISGIIGLAVAALMYIVLTKKKTS